MKKLKIIEIDNYLYTLKDEENKIYKFTFEFHDIETLPKINEYIYMSDELLDINYKEYSNFYAFGSLEDTSGRKVDGDKNIQDVIAVQTDTKKKYLKRLYG